jgi:TolB-like protein/Tfp pilus assembly protein PilF
MSRLKRLIVEVHRRSLWQVLLIYVGAAWACFELIDTVTDRLALPPWLPGLAIVLFLLALPIVVATALIQDGGPTTTISDPTLIPVDEARLETARRRRFLTWRNAVASFVVALAVWGVVATGWLLLGDRGAVPEVEHKSIAVLPFDNIGGAEENVAFTDGIHDDIITHLQMIGDLKPISRTSVLEYREKRGNLRQIAEQLGVATILEGGVQRSGNRVRINAQLIDGETDEHLWAETYEEVLTAENVFTIQTAIAQRIASALKARLSPEESERIAARSTENLEAYEHYVRGRVYFRRGRAVLGIEGLALKDSAIAEYERAVELDPEYSAAWAALAGSRTVLSFQYITRTEEREKGEQALARAVELAPESYETHIAQATYYMLVREDPARAMMHLTVAETLRPNDAETLTAIAGVLTNQGKWEEALTYYERAVELDPRNAEVVREIADTYSFMRRFEEEERYLDRLIALDPSAGLPHQLKFWLYLFELGDTAKARVYAEQHPDEDGWQEAKLHYYRREYEQALIIGRSDSGDREGVLYALYRTGRLEELQAYADSVASERRREISSERLTALQVSFLRSYLGLAYAFAGEIEEAIREGEEALELWPIAADQYNYWLIVKNLCHIYVLAGDHEAAIDQLEVLLSTPNPMTTAWLRLDPFYDPLRDDPRFQALLER